jgi:hypothetical protein
MENDLVVDNCAISCEKVSGKNAYRDCVPGRAKPDSGRPELDMGRMPCEVEPIALVVVAGRASEVPGLNKSGE